ncbi:MAG: class B sortase [Oscillospiraceae bacterium]|jgi:sortase B|nr:class B sortase [Oscillospiraceae bacterium]
MKTNVEIYSVRISDEAIAGFNTVFDETVAELHKNEVNVLFKTEVDYSCNKIYEALEVSTNDANPPEMIVLVNALSTSSSESFRDIFSRTIINYEKEQPLQEVAKAEKATTADKQESADQTTPEDAKKPKKFGKKATPAMLKSKVKIHSLGNCGNEYRGYCFLYKGIKVVALPQTELTEREYSDLIAASVQKAQAIFAAAKEKYPNGFTQVEVKNEKRGFISNIIPLKGDSWGEILRKSIVLAAALAIIVGGYFLARTYIIDPMLNDSFNAQFRTIYDSYSPSIDPEATAPSANLADSNLSKNMFDQLKSKSSAIVGYVKIDNTKINYPVVENTADTSTNQYYLWRDIYGNSSGFGSIFLDFRCSKSVKSKNVIMHGHHMIDGSMFSNLLNYGGTSGNLDFMKASPIIYFDTEDGAGVYKIISYLKVDVDVEPSKFFNYLVADFNSDAQFMNFVYNLRIRSLFDMPVDVNENDSLITLSTCSYEFGADFRTVLVARKVRPGETYSVDTNKIKLNSDALWPDIYYNRYGSSKPSYSSFLNAYDNGSSEVNWYDGDGRPNGDEDLGKTDNMVISEDDKIRFQVTWVNWDNSVLKTELVEEGKSATPPPNPTRPDWSEYKYVFKGWGLPESDWKKVVVSMKIAPIFEKVKR